MANKHIPFTLREMQRAWRENLSASKNNKKSNCFRLLLFYAVECGLKAILMKRARKDFTGNMPELIDIGHDINKLLDELRASVRLKLPKEVYMDAARSSKPIERVIKNDKINQMWRYGGCSVGNITDADIEEKLLHISEWIKEQEGMS
jgi:hypothetical protein